MLHKNGDADEINNDVNEEFNNSDNNCCINVNHTVNICESTLSTSDYDHSDFSYDNDYNADCESGIFYGIIQQFQGYGIKTFRESEKYRYSIVRN